MENFTLKSPYSHLVLLFLCFTTFKLSMSAIHFNPLKMLSQKFMRVFPISLLMMPVNLIQYRGKVGMFNNRRFANSSLNYSYFSKKYNDDTFTLTFGLIVLGFQHLFNVLSNSKFISRFLPDLVGICNFSRKILYFLKIPLFLVL